MRKNVWTIILAISLFAGLQRARAEESDTLKYGKRTVTVEGNGKLQAVPDIARLSVGVMLDGKESEPVAILVRQRTRQLIDVVNAQGIPGKDLQTQQYSVQPKWAYENGKSRKVGYTVSNQLVVTVRDVSQAGKILAALVEAGATNINGPDFDIDNPQLLERKILGLAMDDAKAKAAVLAQAADAKLGPVLTISQSAVNWPGPIPHPPVHVMARAFAVQVPEEPVATGEQTVNATISVTFELR